MPMLYGALLWLHLLAAAFWVGGMAALHFAVRPAAVATLPPPQRLALMSAVLGRFLRGVSAAIGLLLASGVALILLGGGFGQLRWYVAAMLGIGLAMMGLFEQVNRRLHPRLRQAVGAQDWPAGAAALDAIRRRVEINLALGVAVFAVVLIGRTLGIG